MKLTKFINLFFSAILSTVVLTTSTTIAQIQIMSAEDERLWRSYIPKIADDRLTQQIAEALLYTDKEIPPAYQFQPVGSRGGPYTVFFSIRHRHNGSRLPTHGNIEFPWADPGGLEEVDKSTITEFRFLHLPRKESGGVWPIVVWWDWVEKSHSINMPLCKGLRWIFPAGTIVGEVLMKKFSDGRWATYEIRTRTRDLDSWSVEIYRIFSSVDEIREKVDPDLFVSTGVRYYRRFDNTHKVPAFDRNGAEFKIPPIPNAYDLLKNGTFKPVSGTTLTRTKDWYVEAMTADDQDNIVPRKYNAAYLGTSIDGCINCHKHTLRHVDSFTSGRDWYGYIRGSDGIFSFHPVSINSIHLNEGPHKPIRLRDSFVQAGIVAEFDRNIHPDSVYKRIKEVENYPLANSPSNDGVTLGGYR